MARISLQQPYRNPIKLYCALKRIRAVSRPIIILQQLSGVSIAWGFLAILETEENKFDEGYLLYDLAIQRSQGREL